MCIQSWPSKYFIYKYSMYAYLATVIVINNSNHLFKRCIPSAGIRVDCGCTLGVPKGQRLSLDEYTVNFHFKSVNL